MIMLLPGKSDCMPTCSKCKNKDTHSLVIYANLPGLHLELRRYIFSAN